MVDPGEFDWEAWHRRMESAMPGMGDVASAALEGDAGSMRLLWLRALRANEEAERRLKIATRWVRFSAGMFGLALALNVLWLVRLVGWW